MNTSHAVFTSKRVVTKHNKDQFPQYPVGTTLFMLLSDMKSNDNPDGNWHNIVMDRDTLKTKMLSNEISVADLKLDKLNRIIPRFPDVTYFNFISHVRDKIKSGVYAIDSLQFDKDVMTSPLADEETKQFLQRFPDCHSSHLFDIIDGAIQELQDKGYTVYSYGRKTDKKGNSRCYYSCIKDLVPFKACAIKVDPITF